MIKRYNKYVTEKLSDKLSGFNEEELKKQFFNGKIDIKKYLEICKENNIKINKDEIKNWYLNDYINQYNFLKICEKYKFDIFLDDDVLYTFDNFYILNLLEISIKFGSLKGLKYVIENGECDIDINDNQILKTAISNNNLDIVKYAIEEQNVDPNLNNNYPLRIAIINKNFEIVKYLIKHGAKINEDSIILANSINDKQIIEFLKNNK
jgi:ankyrin repeat protein